MKDAIVLELEGKAKELYLDRMKKCFKAATGEIGRKDEHAREMVSRYANTLRMLEYDERRGIYTRMDQDLATGFPSPTLMLGMASKKEDIEEKVDALFTKLSRIAGFAGGEKIGVRVPKLAECEGHYISEKADLLRRALVRVVKEKIYGFTPKQEALLDTLEEYYKDEQEFFRELEFLERLKDTEVIGSKCSQRLSREGSRVRDDGLAEKGVREYDMRLFGQFVNMPLYYRMNILAIVPKKKDIRDMLSEDALDKLFGHSQKDIFNAFMEKKKNMEPVRVARVSFGPFYDENTNVEDPTQAIISEAGEGFALDVKEEAIKRDDREFFKKSVFSKPKILTSEQDRMIKVCSPNLVEALKGEFPEAEVIRAE